MLFTRLSGLRNSPSMYYGFWERTACLYLPACRGIMHPSLSCSVPMIVQEESIDRATGLTAFVNIVPLGDIRFVQLPADVDFFPLQKSGKVHQTGVQIFQ